jgi:hypothetical protein
MELDKWIEEGKKDIERGIEQEIDRIVEFDPDKIFNLMLGLSEAHRRELITEEGFKRLSEKLKKKIQEIVG